MKVIFNAKKAFGFLDVTPELKQRFELVFSKLAEQVLTGANYNNLESIIATDNFVDDVLAFQRENLNGVEGVTSNEYGRAFGKMIYVPTQEKYYVFLDAEYASFLIDDTIFDAIISNLNGDKELTNCIVVQRQCAMNLLAHELEHYKFANSQTAPIVDVDNLDSQYERMMFELFDEYNAARKATEVSSVSVFSYDEEYMLKIEKYIMDNRWKYNTREIDLNQFVALFHQYTRQALMYIAANIGSKHGSENDKNIFDSCRCSPLIRALEEDFDCLFTKAHKGEKVIISTRLIDWLKEYYELFKVYISKTAQGLYYEIPYDEGDAEV